MRGLKTTYYLRTLGATTAEKSNITDGALNVVSPAKKMPEPSVLSCRIDTTECEVCQ